MTHKIKTLIMVAATSFAFLTPVLALTFAGGVASAANNITDGFCEGVEGASGEGCDTNGDPDSTLTNVAADITRWFSIIVGAISIIMIIYGGFRYITSGGDSNRVGAAKNTLIYAIIGLIIVALAQIIVSFVINQSSETVSQ